MRSTLVVIVLVLLTSCSPRSTSKCQRLEVVRSDAGVPEELATELREKHLSVIAPSWWCPGDTLSASAEVIAPDGSLATATLTEPRLGSDGRLVSVILSFTPPTPGLYVVNVDFEPGLGRTSTTVQAVRPTDQLGVTLVLPGSTRCDEPPWPINATTLACESGDGGVTVVSEDGGLRTFLGSGLVGVEEVLWTLNSTGVLERRVWSPTGSQLTHSWPGFSSTPLRGFHTRDTAIRLRTNGFISAVTTDGGEVTAGASTFGSTDLIYTEGDGELRRLGGGCRAGGCPPVGFDSQMAWFASGTGTLGLPRPFTSLDGPPLQLAVSGRDVAPALRGGGLERWPLWVDYPFASVLISPRGDAQLWTAWTRSEVLRVGATHVVVKQGIGYRIVSIE